MRIALICVDPDNGLECAVLPCSLKGVKYACYDELAAFYASGQSLVIYQHTTRRGTVTDQVARRIAELRDRLGVRPPVRAVRFHRGTSRAYLIAAQPHHAKALDDAIDRMMQSAWSRHFSLVEC